MGSTALALFLGLIAAASPAGAHEAGEMPLSASLGSPVAPWPLACLAATLALYACGLARLWAAAGPGAGIARTMAASFLGGWVTVAAALISPLDALAARLFSAHMLQHQLLMLVAAPLLVFGRPFAAWAWALPRRWLEMLAKPLRSWPVRRIWSAVSSPAAAALLQAGLLWVWHMPSFFEAARSDNGIHAWQHASYLLTAALFWWSVFQHSRRGRAAALFALFATMLHSGALGALLAFSRAPWYPAYAGMAAASGADPLEDQQLAGLLMWVPAGLLYLFACVTLAWRWLDDQGARQSAA